MRRIKRLHSSIALLQEARSHKAVLLWAAAATSFGIALPCYAQTTPQLEEVIVTGTKRDERLLDAPLSIQAFNQAAIEQAGIVKVADFLALTPNVNFNTSINQGDLLINVRGQTSVRGAEPAVRVIIDGVPVVSAAEYNTALFDLKQIEVLKGPQGALYGRDAAAGVIIINTQDPPDHFSGQTRVGYGNDNAWQANASIGGPIAGDRLKVRATVVSSGTDGSYTNINTGEHPERFEEVLGRVRADWQVSDRLGAEFFLTAGHGNGGAVAYTPKIAIVPGLSPQGTVVGGVPITNVSTNSGFDIPFVSDVKSRYDRDLFSVAAKLEYDAGIGTLTSVSSYSRTNEHWGGKGLPYGNPNDATTDFFVWQSIFGDTTQNYQVLNHQFDQEIRLTSRADAPMRWQTGVEFLTATQDYLTNNALNGMAPATLTPAQLIGYGGYDAMGNRTLVGGGASVPTPLILRGPSSPYPSTSYYDSYFPARNYAPFGNLQYTFLPGWELGLAARYDTETRKVESIGPDAPDPFLGGQSYNPCVHYSGRTAANCATGDSQTFRQLQPKVTLSYKLRDLGTLYGSWGRSFKSGGYNPIGTRDARVAAQTAINAGLGQGSTVARANAEAAIFTQDSFNKEVADTAELGFKLRFDPAGVTANGAVFYTTVNNAQQYRFDAAASIQSIDNIDKARIKGFELDGSWAVTHALSVFAAFGYVDSRIVALRSAPTLVGNYMPYVPRYTSTVGAQLVLPVSGELSFSARLEAERTGTTWFNVENIPTTQRDPYTLLNARTGVVSDRWQLMLWGKNLADERYAQDAFPLLPFLNVLSLAPRRTFGVEASAKF